MMLSAGDGGRSVIGWRAGNRRFGERVEPQPGGDPPGEVVVDVAQVGDHPGADAGLLALAQLEHEGVDDVGLLDRGLADVELAGLAVVVGEASRSGRAALVPSIGSSKVRKPPSGILARSGCRSGP